MTAPVDPVPAIAPPPPGRVCSQPGCSAPAKYQHQRILSTAENGGVEQVTREDAEWRVEEARAKQRRIIAELEDLRPSVKPDRIPHLERQLKSEQARLDAIVDEPTLATGARPNTMAVFACEDHQVEDPHLLHGESCQAGACGCATSQPFVHETSTLPG